MSDGDKRTGSGPGGTGVAASQPESAKQLDTTLVVIEEAIGSARTQALSADATVAASPAAGASRGDSGFVLPVVSTAVYERGDELARGGMGRILRAADRRLRRPVAIKELLDPDGALRGRFEREALITARLQHPAIVPIYEAGHWPSGEPFYTMKLVSGRPLSEVIAETTSLAERIALLPKAIAVSEAIAYAHKHRVIHRDIKPHNVIVGELGETVVIDWGLAKDLDDATADPMATSSRAPDSSVETVVGSVMGTLAYMPPEQARGDAVDERADVYSLGALLYQLLANRVPHDDAPPRALLAAVLRGPPRSLVDIDPEIPPDLAAIVNKAMARDADSRYPHAGKLVEDLVRFQSGQLVGVHRYSFGELVRRWARRHRTVLVLGALSLVVLAVIGVIAVWRVVEANEVAETNEAEAKRQTGVALEQKRVSDETATALFVEQGRMLMLSGDVERAIVYFVEAYARGDPSTALRQLLTVAMRDAEAAKQTLGPFGGAPAGVGFLPDGKLVHVEDAGRVHVVSRAGVETSTFSVPGGTEYVLDPSARTLAVWRKPSGADPAATRTLELWDVERGVQRWSVRVSHDGDTEMPKLVLGASDRFVVVATYQKAERAELRDARTGNVVATLDTGAAAAIAFSADGSRVAACNGAGAVRIWDATTRAVVASLTGVPECDTIMFAVPDRLVTVDTADRSRAAISQVGQPKPVILEIAGHGPTVAASKHGMIAVVHGFSGNRVLTLWGVNGTRLREAQIQDSVDRLRFSSDGQLLIGSGDSDRLYVWDIPSLQLRHVLEAHREWIHDFAIDPTTHRIATAGAGDRRVRLWAVADLAFAGITSTSLLAGDRWLILHGGTLQVRRQDTYEKIHDIDLGDVATGRAVTVTSRDGRRLVSVVRAGESAVLRIIDPTTASIAPVDIPHPYPPSTAFVLDLSGDGRFVVTSSATDTRVFDASSGRLVRSWVRAVPTSDDLFAELSFDGTHVVTGVAGAMQLLRVGTGDEVPVPALRKVTFGQFDRSGTSLYVLNERADTQVVATRIDVATGKSLRVFAGDQNFAGLGTSDDGRWLATLTASDVAEVRNIETGVAIASVARVSAAALSADGERFATGDRAGAIKVWETATRRELARFQVFSWVQSLELSDDGTRLLAVEAGGLTTLLDVHLEDRPLSELASIAGRYTRWKLDGGALRPK